MEYTSDKQALDVLAVNFNCDRGVIRRKLYLYNATAEERNAISHLCWEWDYAYEPSETRDTDGVIRVYTTDGECHTELSDVDTPGEVLDAWEGYVAKQKPGFPWVLACWSILFLISLGFIAAAVVIHSR